MPEPTNARARFVAADPYPWPFDGDLSPANTALAQNITAPDRSTTARIAGTLRT